MNESTQKSRLLQFLNQELEIPYASINLALHNSQLSYGSLPMLLWQYGLISLSQLDQIFQWQEQWVEL